MMKVGVLWYSVLLFYLWDRVCTKLKLLVLYLWYIMYVYIIYMVTTFEKREQG